jgi:hypothetical protein
MKLRGTDAYDAFLSTWSSSCGVPAHVFKAQLDGMLEEEVIATIRPFVDELTQRLRQMAEKADPISRALDRLLGDLADHLDAHIDDCNDCRHALDCPDRRMLSDRVKKARQILGAPTPAPTNERSPS